MFRKTITGCTFLVAAFAPTALADTFSGPYFGLEAGYEDFSDDLDGGVYGVFAGWDIPVFDNWVIGIEGRLAEPDTSFRLSRDTGTATAVSAVDLNEQYGASLRFGRLFGERTLVFGQVGHEWFEVDATITTTPTPPCQQCAPTLNDFSFDEEMPIYGAGIEHALTEKFRTRLIYTYGDGDAYERNRLSMGIAYAF
ncbi:outer membrane beta-barrel protein [Hyphomonas sp.]|uniref:outer membrane beta-barrel protein n=1 Tax=Hyphomonas sp. TaxID=87 RepID=UPI003241CB27